MNSSIETLISLKIKYPGFYWGKNDSGYYWGDKSKFGNERDWVELMEGFNSLEELVEDIDKYNLCDNSEIEECEKFNEEFYLKLLQYFSVSLPKSRWCVQFYWGIDESGKYYWEDRWGDEEEEDYIYSNNFSTLKELVEDIFQYIQIE
jgi:hypothetical protein